jgi:parallel beta-helix repeat protein
MAGIEVSSLSYHTVISFNNITNNSYYGISLDESNENNIFDNYISNNTLDINIAKSNMNTISFNMILNSKYYGIQILAGSGYNQIQANDFVNNNGANSIYNRSHIQANDTIGTNFWNNSKQGNYWSDWTRPDINPPYGVVDDPYQLDGNLTAKDYYPLTTSVAVPDVSPAPEIILAVILLTAIVVRRRNR